jgi:predicted nuclease of predicted toxin-antitoxin system
VKLALDHHYSPAIARELRDRGFDAIAISERGWQVLSDAALLAACADESLVLLTNNVPDFVALARDWQGQGRQHAGLIFTSDATMPRNVAWIGAYVTALGLVFVANPDVDSLSDRVIWLSPNSS